MSQTPSILYKYIDISGANAFLAQPQIRYADWRELDDLMEVIPGFRPLREDEIGPAAVAQMKTLPQADYAKVCERMRFISQTYTPRTYEVHARKAMANVEKQFAVCCLSERWNSGAMWAQYSERHAGLVFGLKTPAIERIQRAEPDSHIDLKRVEYLEDRPQVGMRLLTDEDRASILRAIRTKSPDWDFQAEWRIIKHNSAANPVQWSDIAEVIVGSEATASLVELAKSRAVENVSVFQTYFDSQRYSMARERLC